MSRKPTIAGDTPPASPARRQWLTVAAGTGGVLAVAAVTPFVADMIPSERNRAAAIPLEVDISRIAPGELMLVDWHGKPVWVLRRTPEMLASLVKAEPRLADPNSREIQQPEYAANSHRSIRPEIFVAVAVCTHLGCSPAKAFIPGDPGLGAGWPGGFLCPCHGSTFDLAGRVFRNMPAPSNLVIPPHSYLSDKRLLIGSDKGVPS